MLTTRVVHVAKVIATAPKVAPSGRRNFDQAMYWRAAGTTIFADDAMGGHHCRSFQSLQKSQSPPHRMRVTCIPAITRNRSEERRVGKECRYRWCEER